MINLNSKFPEHTMNVMNIPILKRYGMTFIKKIDGTKFISNSPSSFIASYISEYNDPDIIQEYLDDIDLVLSGNYEQIDDTTKSTEFIYAKLYPDGLYFDETKMLPLHDLRGLLSSWKEFLVEY